MSYRKQIKVVTELGVLDGFHMGDHWRCRVVDGDRPAVVQIPIDEAFEQPEEEGSDSSGPADPED